MPFDAAPDHDGILVMRDGARIFWLTSGNPEGIPVLHLHGGPGSGTSGGFARRQDPNTYLGISFDQRGCGRSTPLATEPGALRHNNTPQLIADIEELREHLGIERWIVAGGSWGATLALLYAQAHPARVLGLVVVAVPFTTAREVEWLTEGMGRFFPEEWERFAQAVERRDGERIVYAYARVLGSGTSAERLQAARSWCRWEDVHVSLVDGFVPRLSVSTDSHQLVFATLVTHYWSHSGFGGEGILPGMARVQHLPGVIVHGRRDISLPLESAWLLHRAWPGSVLHVVEEGHGGPRMTELMEAAIAEIGATHLPDQGG